MSTRAARRYRMLRRAPCSWETSFLSPDVVHSLSVDNLLDPKSNGQKEFAIINVINTYLEIRDVYQSFASTPKFAKRSPSL
jgi:hypothetical protein